MGSFSSILDSAKNSLMYVPRKVDARTTMRNAEEGWIDNINYIMIKKNSSTLIIYSHGNAGNIYERKQEINLMREYDVDVVAYDYPGYGKSKGAPSTSSCIESLEKIYLMFAPQYEKIILWGESIGGGVSAEFLKIAVDKGYKLPSAIIHYHSFHSLKHFVNEKIWFGSMFVDEYEVLKIFKEYLDDIPLVLVASEEDELFGTHHALKIKEELIDATFIQNTGEHCSYTLTESMKLAIKNIIFK